MNNQSNKPVQNFLFESIGYQSNQDVRNLIENLNLEQSIFFIDKALQYSYGKGIYSMTETEILSKSLFILNSKIFTNEQSGQGPVNFEDNPTSTKGV